MLDWWEAAILSLIASVAGGVIALITAYFSFRWTTTASREAEEREARRQAAREEREATRRLRREQAQPIIDFLIVVKQYLNVEKTPKLTPEIPREFDKSQHFANLRAKEMLDWLHGYDASNREVRDAVVVAGSTACSEEVSDAIKNTLDALVGYSASSYDDAGAAKVMAAVQRSEAELERYIVAVE